MYNLIDVFNYSKLDTTSVMMYFMPGSLNEQGNDVEVNNELSDTDKAYMVINYPRNVTHPAAPEWTLEHALGIAGVPENVQKDIAAAGTNLAAARSLFAKWNKEARLKELQDLTASTTPADEGTRLVALLSELASKLLLHRFCPLLESSTPFGLALLVYLVILCSRKRSRVSSALF